MTNRQENSKSHLYASCMEEISALIQASVPILYVVTHDEDRFIKDLKASFVDKTNKDLWLWSSYQGLLKYKDVSAVSIASGSEAKTNNPQVALKRIVDINSENGEPSPMFVLRDFHTVLVEPIPRQIRDIYDHLTDCNKTIIITAPMIAHGPAGQKAGLPPTLEKQITVVHYGLPQLEEIKGYINFAIDEIKYSVEDEESSSVKLKYDDEEIVDLARACRGLTKYEIDNSIATSYVHMQEINLQKLISDKRQIIRKSEILEFIDNPVSMDDVGGLDNAKIFLRRYAKANTEEAKEFGVEPLSGILLTGIPGTGKSLLAKAVGNLWKAPLLRLDVGKVMTGLVGGSEGKMREVIAQAESMSPAVLWIDEVEKSLSGTKSSNFSDGGTLSRVFGTLLTAMQDGLKGVTIVATANDISMLPPEFIRRFNEVFFVDLPSSDERWEILKIHMQKRNRNIKIFTNSKSDILKASKGFTGAEMEKAVKDAIANAFYNERKEIVADDLMMALSDTKPISVVQGDKVKKLREAARGQYRFASSSAEKALQNTNVKTKKGKEINLDKAVSDFAEIKTSKEKVKQEQENRLGGGRFKNL